MSANDQSSGATRVGWPPERWNALYPSGTPVAVRPIMPNPPQYKTRTRGKAWALGSGTAVVLLEGRSGGYHLGALDVLTEEEFAASPLPVPPSRLDELHSRRALLLEELAEVNREIRMETPQPVCDCDLEHPYDVAASAVERLYVAAARLAHAGETAEAEFERAEDACVDALDAICEASPLERHSVLRDLLSQIHDRDLLDLASSLRDWVSP